MCNTFATAIGNLLINNLICVKPIQLCVKDIGVMDNSALPTHRVCNGYKTVVIAEIFYIKNAVL